MKNLALFLDVFISVGIAMCLVVIGYCLGRGASTRRHEKETNVADHTCCHQGPPEPEHIIPPPPPRKQTKDEFPSCGHRGGPWPDPQDMLPPPPPRKPRDR